MSNDWNSPFADEAPPEPGIDITRPAAARVYDYYLGGKDNYPVDRAMADAVLADAPDARVVALANRRWAARVARALVEAGAEILVDIGTGLPTSPSVEEVGEDLLVPVFGADNDSIVLAHYRALQPGGSTVVRADAREPDDMLSKLAAAGVDWTRKVGLIFGAVFHFVPGDLTTCLAAYRDALAPGSFLAVSHAFRDQEDAAADTCTRTYRDSELPVQFRTEGEITALAGGWPLLDPGLVDVQDWRPADHREPSTSIRIKGCVARKPA